LPLNRELMSQAANGSVGQDAGDDARNIPDKANPRGSGSLGIPSKRTRDGAG